VSTTGQLSIFDVLQSTSTFGGETYDHHRDEKRLTKQLEKVEALMRDGKWRTLKQIAHETDSPESSVSARLRDLRKSKFGGYSVEREFVERGLWRYRVSDGEAV